MFDCCRHKSPPSSKSRNISRWCYFYSLGDIIDDYAIDPHFRNDLTAIMKVVTNKNGILSVDAYPSRIKDMKLHLLDKDDPDYEYVATLLNSNEL